MKSKNVSVILLAGGIGSRMQSQVPKQFLMLKNKPIALYSFELFLSLPEVSELVVVCAPQFRHLFTSNQSLIPISFALPGERRQDSVYNGLQAMTLSSSLTCIHDSARPFITEKLIRRVIDAAWDHDAAAPGMPVRFTVKECDGKQVVVSTPDRNNIWEIQTPQVIRTEILKKGFAHALENGLTVTDDVSLVEHLKLPVKLVEGSYNNCKITVPEDLALSEFLLKESHGRE